MGATWTFHSAGQIIFGPGAVTQLGEVATRLGLRQIHLISDPILDRAGIVAQVREPLRQAGVEVLVDLGGEPEPTLAAALHCLERARAWQPDAIIGLGGGSNMDLAKLTAKCFTHGGQPGDYTGDDRLPGPILPLICILPPLAQVRRFPAPMSTPIPNRESNLAASAIICAPAWH